MATGFTRTLRFLNNDTASRLNLGYSITVTLLGVCLAWGAMARVKLYEVTPAARLEVDRAVYPVQAPVGGKVAKTHLRVGREVQEGDVLVELDSSSVLLQRQEEETRLATYRQEIAGLEAQIESGQRAQSEGLRAASIAALEAEATARQSKAPASLAALEEDRLRRLKEAGLIADREYERARATLQQSQATEARDQITVARVAQEHRVLDTSRAEHLKELWTSVARLNGQAQTSEATLARLTNEIKTLAIRVPVNGRLGEVASVAAGTVLRPGDRVATVIPSGSHIVVAQYSPQSALGRIKPGQPAQIRLLGFPWTRYGTLATHVHRVASEIRDGSVRVELTVDNPRHSQIPLEHGLPGSAEIEVERITPLALLIRHVGRSMTQPEVARQALAAGTH